MRTFSQMWGTEDKVSQEGRGRQYDSADHFPISGKYYEVQVMSSNQKVSTSIH